MVKMNGDHPSMDSNCDESFVVLERCTDSGSQSRMADSVMSSMGSQHFPRANGEVESAVPSVVSVQSVNPLLNMTSEMIQQRLQELLKENENLKETVEQNNLAMREQYRTLQMWQEETYKVHQNHKEKFESTKAFINKLTLENKELKKALAEKPQVEAENNEANSKMLADNADLLKQVNELQERLNAAHHREAKLLQPSTKEAELNALVERLSKQLEVAERARRQLGIDNERLIAQQSRMHQQPLPSSVVLLGDNSKQENVQPVEQIKRYSHWLQQLAKVEDELTNGGVSLESWMHIETHGDLSIEVRELRKLLTQEQRLSTSRKEAIGEVRQYFQRLLSDYQSLYQDWEWVKQENANKAQEIAFDKTQRDSCNEQIDNLTAQLIEKSEDLNRKTSYVESLNENIKKLKSENEAIKRHAAQERDIAFEEAQRKGYTEKIDSLTAQLIEKAEELNQKGSYVESLTEQIKKLKSEKEDIEILKAQLNVYKMDFEQERKSREELVSVKDRLAEDLHHLQRRNQQLLDDLDKMRKCTEGGDNTGNRRASSPAQVHQGSQERSPPPTQKFTCPNPDCGKIFSMYEPLERHVIQCLKLDD